MVCQLTGVADKTANLLFIYAPLWSYIVNSVENVTPKEIYI